MKAIYKIENKINHKIYIGQSNDPVRRFKDHLNMNAEYTSLLSRAILKYGNENFTMEILGWFSNYNEKEQEFIKLYRSLAPYGYNILPGGEDPPHGRFEKNNNTSRLNKEIFAAQEELLDYSIHRSQIKKKYHLTEDMMRHIIDGTSWHRDDLNYPLRPPERVLDEQRADKVINLLLNTQLSQKEIGKLVGWNRSAITMINIGKNHHRDTLNYPLRK